jgi:hypothetical protein
MLELREAFSDMATFSTAGPRRGEIVSQPREALQTDNHDPAVHSKAFNFETWSGLLILLLRVVYVRAIAQPRL